MNNQISLKELILSHTKGITPKYVPESDVIVLNQKCIRNNRIDYSFAQFHDPEKKFSESKIVQVGDILINSTGQGTAGRCAFVKSIPKGKKLITDSHILIVRIGDFHTAGCVEYSLFSVEKMLQTFMDGSTGQGEFDKQRLFNIVLSLPDENKRSSAYKILDDIDTKIELNQRINVELEAMAKLIYEYWFVQFDFPNENGQPYKSSGGKMVYDEILKREIPDGWKSGIASDLFCFNPSLSLPANQAASYIDMNSLPVSGFMTKKPDTKLFGGGVKFQNGDVAVARITPCLENGKTGLITMLDDGEIGFGSTEFIIIRGKDRSLSAFASMLSRSASFRQFAILNMTGTSGRKRIEAKVMELFGLPIPPKDILDSYEELVRPLFKKMTVNATQNEELTVLRDWLLPVLMNGQVTVEM